MFELFEVEEKDKNIIYNLMQLYTYELSFFEDETTNFQLIENGLFKMSKYIELYWTQEKRHPYILKCDGKLAGFVLERFNENGMNDIEHLELEHLWQTKCLKNIKENGRYEHY